MIRAAKLFFVIGCIVTLAVGCGYQQSSGSSSSSSSASSGSSGYSATTAEVSLVNDSNAPIYQVYMSSASQSSWGNELLTGRVLQPGQSFDLSNVAPGVWDIRVVDRDGLWKEFYGQQVNANGNHRLVITSGEWNQSFR